MPDAMIVVNDDVILLKYTYPGSSSNQNTEIKNIYDDIRERLSIAYVDSKGPD